MSPSSPFVYLRTLCNLKKALSRSFEISGISLCSMSPTMRCKLFNCWQMGTPFELHFAEIHPRDVRSEERGSMIQGLEVKATVQWQIRPPLPTTYKYNLTTMLISFSDIIFDNSFTGTISSLLLCLSAITLNEKVKETNLVRPPNWLGNRTSWVPSESKTLRFQDHQFQAVTPSIGHSHVK